MRVASPRTWRRLAAAALGALIVIAASGPGAAQSSALEQAIKATYIYKLVPFVGWPAAAFGAPGAPVVLCVVRDAAFATLLERAVGGERVGDRAAVVRRLQAVDRDSGCHVIYLGAAGSAAAAELLEILRGAPVLTVTDGARAASPAGIINFVIDNNRVRFEIDAAAAAENGLSISSKLLSLAVSVKPPRA